MKSEESRKFKVTLIRKQVSDIPEPIEGVSVHEVRDKIRKEIHSGSRKLKWNNTWYEIIKVEEM